MLCVAVTRRFEH